MLAVSKSAAVVIQDLLTSARLSAGSGLRLAQRDDHTALAMTMCAGPGHEDVVVVEHEVAVFLGPVAAQRTMDQTLEATSSTTGRSFYLRA